MERLQSLSLACQSSVFELSRCIVVDNASGDGSADRLDQLALPLVVLRNLENTGFAHACNQGAKAGAAEYVLFLNPDVQLFSDSLEKALVFLAEPQNENVGIVGIQLTDENGVVQRNVARFPTPGALFSQMVGLDRLSPAHFPALFMVEWDHRSSRAVDQVPGAFFLIRRHVFEKLHGFDERFFLYFEDLDLAWRARQAGFASYYLAEARAFHRGGGTTSQVKAQRLFYILRSRVQYVAKHFGRPAAVSIMLASLAFEFWLRLALSLIRFSVSSFVETAQAYGLFVRALPRLFADLKAE